MKKQGRLERIPGWSENALQGLAYWIGYQRIYYRHYPLTEGALVCEACKIIAANLRDKEYLLCEIEYRRLIKPKSKLKFIDSKKRSDLVIVGPPILEANDRHNIWQQVKAVIEVKRYSAGRQNIEIDLMRLYEALKYGNKYMRAFLIIVSQNKRPRAFVNKKGKSIRELKSISGVNGKYKVRRTCKATASFHSNTRETSHYASLLEVIRST